MGQTRCVRRCAVPCVVVLLAAQAHGQTVWTGDPIEFVKPDGVDGTLEENQDELTESVRIARQSFLGIYNAAQENGFTDLSPADTEWAFGAAEDFADLDFQEWVEWAEFAPPDTVGKPAVVHLISDDIYVDIEFTSWSCCGAGGFSYIRATPGAACPPDVNGDGSLDIFDFVAFQQAFLAEDPIADCTGDEAFDVFDFVCFQGEFLDGCP